MKSKKFTKIDDPHSHLAFVTPTWEKSIVYTKCIILTENHLVRLHENGNIDSFL